MSLAQQIANRAAAAPQTRISTVNPARLQEMQMAAIYDKDRQRIQHEYNEDRERTMAHLRFMLDKERDKISRDAEQDIAMRKRLYELGEAGYGMPLLDPNASDLERQYALSAAQKGAQAAKTRSSRNRMTTDIYGQLGEFDEVAQARAAEKRYVSDAEVKAYLDSDAAKGLREQIGYNTKVGFQDREGMDKARAAYLNSMEGMGKKQAIDDYLEELRKQHNLRQAKLQHLYASLSSQGGVVDYDTISQMNQMRMNPIVGEPEATSEEDDYVKTPTDKTKKQKKEAGPLGKTVRGAANVAGGLYATKLGSDIYRGQQGKLIGEDLFGRFDSNTMSKAQGVSEAKETLAEKKAKASGPWQNKHERLMEADEAKKKLLSANAELKKQLRSMSPAERQRAYASMRKGSNDIMKVAFELMKENGVSDSKLQKQFKLATDMSKSAAERSRASLNILNKFEAAWSDGKITKAGRASAKAAGAAGLKKGVFANALKFLGKRALAAAGPIGLAVSGGLLIKDIFFSD